MNLVVVLRAVQDPAGLMVNRRAHKVFVNREAYRLNPADHNALEAALRLAAGGQTVTAVSYGGPPADTVLRDALAAGAQRAVWVREPALQFSDSTVLTQVVQAVIQFIGGADLVLLGADVLDADVTSVAPRLAVAGEAAFVGEAHDLRLTESGAVQAVVRGPAGFRWVEANLPGVVTVLRDSNQPRYPSAPNLITVYSNPDAVEVVTPAELGLDEAQLAPLTMRRGEAFPPERELGVVAEGNATTTAQRVAELLRPYGHS